MINVGHLKGKFLEDYNIFPTNMVLDLRQK
jgi:hypothetical protein